jgi:hypothetical protein
VLMTRSSEQLRGQLSPGLVPGSKSPKPLYRYVHQHFAINITLLGRGGKNYCALLGIGRKIIGRLIC